MANIATDQFRNLCIMQIYVTLPQMHCIKPNVPQLTIIVMPKSKHNETG